MESPIRPRRSVLYMPGANARALEKARGLAADSLIPDLEDAVAVGEKERARALVAKTVAARPYGRREVVIRINGFDTPWGEADLEMAAAAAPDAILVPKVETPDLVEWLAERLGELGAPVATRIWAMIETPAAILRVAEIAAASPRLACLVMGTNDLVNELHAEHTPERLPVLTSLSLSLLAARANGLAIIDGVHNAIRDLDGLRAVCRQARQLGFDGKTLIHPGQIAVANEVFAPDEAELEQAGRIIAAFEAAEAEGRGVTVVDGRLVENLHVENARRLMALAEAIAMLESERTQGEDG